MTQIFPLSDPALFKAQLFAFTSRFSPLAYYDSNQRAEQFECLVGWGDAECIQATNGQAFAQLNAHRLRVKDWLLGYLSYDLKNELEALQSPTETGLHWPELYFFQPQKLVIIKNATAEFHYLPAFSADIQPDFEHIVQTTPLPSVYPLKINWNARTSRSRYFAQFERIQHHLQRGDIYEVNYCQEFYTHLADLDTAKAFTTLNAVAQAPFSCYFSTDQHALLCASPERYLQKSGKQLLSQPIKGTIRRGSTESEDQALLKQLQNNPKERSENIMIVDLVRNDLSRTAAKNSVEVIDLCGGYPFNNVQHLISSITSILDSQYTPIDAITNSFPMGSMTGAPKIRAMEIASNVEDFKRGLYSGAVGYFTPEDDFDFNVVIRSLQFNRANGYLSYAVGSAVTAAAQAEEEYNECLLKAINILRSFQTD